MVRKLLRFHEGRREQLIDLLAAPGSEFLSKAEIAARLGVHICTLRRHLTQEVWAEALRRRELPTEDELRQVDRAMIAEAKAGNVGAARLVYGRLQEIAARHVGEDDLPGEAELEEALALVRNR